MEAMSRVLQEQIFGGNHVNQRRPFHKSKMIMVLVVALIKIVRTFLSKDHFLSTIITALLLLTLNIFLTFPLHK